MIGVVVWSSEDRQKAVIWCEDHGALAYLQGSENLREGEHWPTPGDLLELESETVGNIRHARRVACLNARPCPEIPAILRGDVAPPLHVRLVSSREETAAPVRAEVEDEDVLIAARLSAAR